MTLKTKKTNLKTTKTRTTETTIKKTTDINLELLSCNFKFLSSFIFILQFGSGPSTTRQLCMLTSSPRFMSHLIFISYLISPSSSSHWTTSPSPAPSIPLWESPMKGRNLDKHSKNSFVHFQYCMLQQNRTEKRIFSTTWQSRVHFTSVLSLLAAKSLSRKWDKHPFWEAFSDFTLFDLKMFIQILFAFLSKNPVAPLQNCVESVSRIWLYLCKNVLLHYSQKIYLIF